MDVRRVPVDELVRLIRNDHHNKHKRKALQNILQILLKNKYKTSKLTGLKNRKTNDVYTRLHEDCQVYIKQIITKYREIQLEKNGKKVKSNKLVLEEQKELIEEFTGKTLLVHLKSLFTLYMGTGHVIDAFRILKTIGSRYSDSLYVMFEIFKFYLEIGNLRKAESFLLSVILPLKKSPWHLTIYSMLLFQMKKYKEALIIYRVNKHIQFKIYILIMFFYLNFGIIH